MGTSAMIQNNPVSAVYIAEERLYLDKDGKVVKSDDPTRVQLLVCEGGKLSLDRARDLGLITGAQQKAATGTVKPK